MVFPRVIPLVLSALFLGGCVVASPFEGPGFSRSGALDDALEGPLIASVTYARIKDDGVSRRTFFANADAVEAALPQQPGFVGFSKRADLLGNEAWTLTVWRDRESLLAFVNGAVHRRAVQAAWDSFDDARFARLTIAAADMPLGWDRALAALESDGRAYYE